MLEVKNLTKVYDDGTVALKDVSFTVQDGEFVVIIGLSGSGKSTLLRCINRLIDPTEGEIIWNGVHVETATTEELRVIRRQIGMIFQHFNLVKRSSVMANVLSGRLGYVNPWRSVLNRFSEEDRRMAREALERLQAGNLRFVEMLSGGEMRHARSRRLELTSTQTPVAIVLGCSDSRAPVEFIFDQGLGDLFVIRVAGNIAGPSQTGSSEYTVKILGTRLVVVLGHCLCGAVQAAIDQHETPSEELSPNLKSITEFIRPSIEARLKSDPDQGREALVDKVVRANICRSVKQLKLNSSILAELIQEDDLKIVGAEYSLETGLVEFLDGGEHKI